MKSGKAALMFTSKTCEKLQMKIGSQSAKIQDEKETNIV